MQKMNEISILKKDNWVEKQNILNEMKSTQMSLQELRFFSIYLSKINARDINTRVVDFPLVDFLKIMDIGKVNISCLKLTLGSLLSKVIFVPNEDDGFSGFQLFKECVVYRNKIDAQWHIKIDAHDKALKYMFDFKEKYFKYELWNALSLKSANQIRMYELLKQYETIGVRIIKIEELKKLLGISKSSYTRFNSFRERIIDTAKMALLKYTDICFEYETIKHGKKVYAIKFYISKNKGCKDKINLSEFISSKKIEPKIQDDCENIGIDYEIYSDMFDNVFSGVQVEVIYQMSLPIINRQRTLFNKSFELAACDYFRLLYKRLNASPFEVKSPFAYVKKLISVDLNEMLEA